MMFSPTPLSAGVLMVSLSTFAHKWQLQTNNANLIWVWGMLDLSLSSSKVLFQIPKWQISESVEMVTQRENGGRHVKTVLSQTLSQREQAAKPTEFVFLINVSVL